jgi:hypothetical protein
MKRPSSISQSIYDVKNKKLHCLAKPAPARPRTDGLGRASLCDQRRNQRRDHMHHDIGRKVGYHGALQTQLPMRSQSRPQGSWRPLGSLRSIDY